MKKNGGIEFDLSYADKLEGEDLIGIKETAKQNIERIKANNRCLNALVKAEIDYIVYTLGQVNKKIMALRVAYKHDPNPNLKKLMDEQFDKKKSYAGKLKMIKESVRFIRSIIHDKRMDHEQILDQTKAMLAKHKKSNFFREDNTLSYMG